MVGRDAAESIKIITREASERIARFAFEYAVANGRHKVTAVHKANIMKLSDGLFLESCRTIAAEYEGRIEFEDRIVDNMCMQLVQKPELYDVLVLPNLYGDIVSDLCAGLVGGLGVAPGANIGTEAAVFEPVHGSAPKYAGLDKANPTAMILSGALMLRHMGYPDEATRLETAVRDVIAEGTATTYDLGGSTGTAAFADAIVDRLDRRLRGPMTGLPASLRLPRKPPGTASQGFGATSRIDDWATEPGIVAFGFTAFIVYSLFSALLWYPLFGVAYEVDGYLSPFFSPLIQPDWMPTWFSPAILILWIPLGFRTTCYYYRKAYYRSYFADPPACAVGEPTRPQEVPDGDGLPVHPPEPPPLLPVPRVRPALLPVARRVPVVPARRSVADRARDAGPAVQRAPAERLFAVLPLVPPPGRWQPRLLLVQPPHPGPLQAVEPGDLDEPVPHALGVGQPDLGRAGRPVHPAARDGRHHRPGDLLLAGIRWPSPRR